MPPATFVPNRTYLILQSTETLVMLGLFNNTKDAANNETYARKLTGKLTDGVHHHEGKRVTGS